jgi:3-phenylpropionate/trans-cinnamate dioxygenase alpha subunit
MGLGHETDNHDRLPGRINDMYFGEGPQRAFYRRWLDFMTSEEWPYCVEFPSAALETVAR